MRSASPQRQRGAGKIVTGQRCLSLFLCMVVCLFSGCGKAPVVQQESFVFGTRVEVLVAEPDEARARVGIKAVLREFDRLHRAYHAWQPSELTALNAVIAAGKPAEVSPELAQLIRDAQGLAAAGEYLFDPGIGRLVKLWGFHADEFRAALPDPTALAEWRRAQPSIADLVVDGNRVASRKPGPSQLALDFGGYLKGVALDRAAATLRAQGINNALINIGGNLMALGSKHGEPWRVGIQHPRQPGPLATLELRDGEAIGTSGDYQRYFELGGKRYCHLLDPRSAAPVTHTQAITVLITPRPDAGMLSDAASKPPFIAGPGDWRRLTRQLGVEHALRVDADGRVQASRALAARIKPEGATTLEIVD